MWKGLQLFIITFLNPLQQPLPLILVQTMILNKKKDGNKMQWTLFHNSYHKFAINWQKKQKQIKAKVGTEIDEKQTSSNKKDLTSKILLYSPIQ